VQLLSAVGSSILAFTNVIILDNAAFLFVPPAPSSTIIKSLVVRSSPISDPPSIFNAVKETLFAVPIVPNFVSAILLIARVIVPDEVTGLLPTVNSEAPESATPTRSYCTNI
jgi:hypothetical protein